MYQKIELSANSCVSQGSCIAQKANELFDRRDKVTVNRVQYSELGEEPCLLWWLAAKHLFLPPPGDLGQHYTKPKQSCDRLQSTHSRNEILWICYRATVPWIWSPLSRPIEIRWLSSGDATVLWIWYSILLQYHEQYFLHLLQYHAFG
jgi:hypothetical protein